MEKIINYGIAFYKKNCKVRMAYGINGFPLTRRTKVRCMSRFTAISKRKSGRDGSRRGSRLPSTRILAQNLKVSRSTTQMAYDQLLAEGYAEAFPCRGYFACKIDELVEVRQTAAAPETRKAGGEHLRGGFSPRALTWTGFLQYMEKNQPEYPGGRQ